LDALALATDVGAFVGGVAAAAAATFGAAGGVAEAAASLASTGLGGGIAVAPVVVGPAAVVGCAPHATSTSSASAA
jgi:hypothetical protein